MITLNTTSKLLVDIIAAMVFLSYFLLPRLNKRGYLVTLRMVSCLIAGGSSLFLIVTALRSRRLLDSYFYHDPITGWKVFWMAWDWLVGFFFLFIFLKYWRYYIKHDEKTILTNWYIKENFSLVKKEKYNEAYQYLQKASGISPDSVFIWCALAYFSELFLKTPDQADQYLAKAKQVLGSFGQPTDKDKAILEHYTGTILRYRGRLQEGLEHLKKAYDLDPTPYRKKEYDSALKEVQENTAGQ
jgi:tetratricopeptide (TPR) repeat protein